MAKNIKRSPYLSYQYARMRAKKVFDFVRFGDILEIRNRSTVIYMSITHKTMTTSGIGNARSYAFSLQGNVGIALNCPKKGLYKNRKYVIDGIYMTTLLTGYEEKLIVHRNKLK